MVFVILVLLASAILVLGLLGLKERESTCPGGKVDLKGRGEVIDYQLDNGILRLRMKKPGSDDIEVVLVDECTGRIKASLTIDDNVLKLPEE